VKSSEFFHTSIYLFIFQFTNEYDSGFYSNRGLVLVLNFFRFIIVPLLKDAGPSQELCKQLKVAKDRVYGACDPSISWMKEDVTRTWLEVDTYVKVGS
jgi:hypothetical protein